MEPCQTASTTLEQIGRRERGSGQSRRQTVSSNRVTIWGLPLARVTFQQTVAMVDQLIERHRPGFFITANLHYAMLANRDPRLRAANGQAAFIVADGMPLVSYSRLKRQPLPERVAGADLIYGLCERAAQRGHRVFLLGGAPGVAEQAAGKLCRRYPGLQIVGVEVPPFRELTSQEHSQLIGRIRAARPDLLLVALGQPKGEIWLAENFRALGVPVCVQVGATFDFVAGRVRRAPKWMQKIGLEWFHRILSEPRRLLPRYVHNALFLLQALTRDLSAAFR